MTSWIIKSMLFWQATRYFVFCSAKGRKSRFSTGFPLSALFGTIMHETFLYVDAHSYSPWGISTYIETTQSPSRCHDDRTPLLFLFHYRHRYSCSYKGENLRSPAHRYQYHQGSIFQRKYQRPSLAQRRYWDLEHQGFQRGNPDWTSLQWI